MSRWDGPRRWWDHEYPTFAERMRERRLARREAREDRAAERDFPRRFAARRFAERRFDPDFSRTESFARDEDDRDDQEMRELFGFDDEADLPPRFDRWREDRSRRFAARPIMRAFDEEGPIARIVQRIDPETVGRFIDRFANGRGVDVDIDVRGEPAGRGRDLWEGWDSPREAAEPSRDIAREPEMRDDADRERDVLEDSERERRPDFERDGDLERDLDSDRQEENE